MDDVIVRLEDMPFGVRGVTVKDENGYYNVYINSRYPEDVRRETYRHEMKHILRGDFYRDADVREKERV